MSTISKGMIWLNKMWMVGKRKTSQRVISKLTLVRYENYMKIIWKIYDTMMLKVSAIVEIMFWGYIFVRSENHESKVNNSFTVWRPMLLPEDRSWKTGEKWSSQCMCCQWGWRCRADNLEGIKFILPWESDEVSTAFIP